MLIKADMYAAGGGSSVVYETDTIAPSQTITKNNVTNGILWIWHDKTLYCVYVASVFDKTYTTYGQTTSNFAVSYDSTTETLTIKNNHSISYHVEFAYW